MGENMETTASTVRIGGCEGPEAMYVKLFSADDHEFFIKRETALASGTIKAMLSGPGQYRENEANEICFKEIPSHVLSKICTYFMYRVKYADSAQEVPEFPIAADIAFELLMIPTGKNDMNEVVICYSDTCDMLFNTNLSWLQSAALK